MPTDLSTLILLARRQVRLARARQYAAWACVVVAAAMVSATWTGWVDNSLVCMALIPAAAIVGYVRRPPGDLSIAQHLDEQLHTRDLLASGIACMNQDDDASRLIVSQANLLASKVDRTRLGAPHGVSRGELAAGLLVGIAIVIVLTLAWPGSTLSTTESLAKRTRSERTQTASRDRPAGDSRPPDEARNAAGREGASSAESEPDGAGISGSNEPAGKSRDAAGEGMASTESRTAPPPPSRSTLPETSDANTLDVVGAGMGAGSGDSHGTSGSGIAVRQPVSIADAIRPSEAARDRARIALEANQLDFACRDLVRAYFDLDQPR